MGIVYDSRDKHSWEDKKEGEYKKRGTTNFVVVGEDGKEGLSIASMFKTLLIMQMGYALDLGRLAMQDSTKFSEYQRMLKDKTYNTIEMTLKLLESHGHTLPEGR